MAAADTIAVIVHSAKKHTKENCILTTKRKRVAAAAVVVAAKFCRIAMEKLNAIFDDREVVVAQDHKNLAWREHTRLIRGNPVRVYKGEKFERIR